MPKKDFWFTLILFLLLAVMVPIVLFGLNILKIVDTFLANIGL